MNKPLALIAASMVLFAAPVAAEDWYQLASTSEVIGYGDAESLMVEDGIASARVMLGLREPMGSEGNIEYLLSSVRFSCSEARYFVEEVSGLDAARSPVAELAGSQEWREISDGSMNASFREFACGATSAFPSEDPFADASRYWAGEPAALDSHAYEMAGDFDVG